MGDHKEKSSSSVARRRPPTVTQVERKLPWRQLTILCLVRFSEPIALTSVFPYQPEMIQSFPGVKPADVGFWTGVSSTVFATAQCFTAIHWGKASDRYGRKWIILIGLFNTMVASVLWGFSTTLPMALAVRALSGGVNGNVGVIRTVVAEHCPWKELQPRAFSLMPLVFNIGSIVGPALGGALANPLHRPSGDRSPGPFLWRFPYALPNLVAAGVFLVGIFIGIFFLEETHELKKNKRDPFLRIGDRAAVLLRNFWRRGKGLLTRREVEYPVADETEYAALPGSPEQFDETFDEEGGSSSSSSPIELESSRTPTVREVLTKDTVLFLIVYTGMAMHNTAFDQIISVFMHQSRTGPEILPDGSWYRFNKGFGMDPTTTGIFFTLNGIAGIILQLWLFAPLTKRFGSLFVLRVCLCILPILYFILPFTVLAEPQWLRHTLMFTVWMLKGIAAIFAFPTCTILITNSAKNLRHLGTVNGITTALGAVGRATGPLAVGYVFTWGIHHGLLVAPFWLNSLICVGTWYAVFIAKEGPGFGEDPVEIEELVRPYEDDEDGLADDESEGKRRKKKGKRVSSDKDGGETQSKMVEEVLFSDSEDEGNDKSKLLRPDNQFPVTRLGRSGEARPSVSRRRSATPIGIGEGFRKLSTNLGVSNSGWGSGSEL